jgi:S1-C subfamily serine protease
MEQNFRPTQAAGPRGQGHRLTIILLVLVCLVLAFQVRHWFSSPSNRNSTARAVTPRGDLAQDEKATIELFEQVSPAVVFITSLTIQQAPFSLNALQSPKGSGSGFIWDENGYVVTNYHVIEGAQGADVTLSDQSTWKADLVGVEEDKDLAVLKIEAPKDRLRAIALGTSANLQVGQKVFAIGNPFGLDQTLTTGVISGLGREIQAITGRPIQGVIQTDAAINPGNSGGPLLDSAGRIIGINTMILSPSGAYAGVGFAVPVDVVNRMVPQIIRYGQVKKPGFGIRSWPDHIVQRLGVKGMLIYDMERGGAASRAGLRPTRIDARRRVMLGDIITGIDGKTVANLNDLFRILDFHNIGDTVRVQIQREGRQTQVDVTLQAFKKLN